MENDKYKKRLIDDKLDRYLSVFGAVSIEGAKWCGKTWTSLNHANSVVYLSNKTTRELAIIDPSNVFTLEYPELIDEWQLVPSVWDAVRNKCDEDTIRGKFILTGSTTLSKEDEEEVFHSGAGRIAILKMYPMSLYESGDSSGSVSLREMLDGNVTCKYLGKVDLLHIANLIIRGGFPANIDVKDENSMLIPRGYIDTIIAKDIHERKDRKRSQIKMMMLLRSLSRNESCIVSNNTIISDMFNNESTEEMFESRQTVADYMEVLEDLYLICNQEAFSINYRSSKRVGKSVKRHLVDPSLACASLKLTSEKLMNDFNTFGLMFESLVARDLRVYMDYLDGHLYHFRDNVSGDEVDAILEFADGEYAAVEIKLSWNRVQDAINSLQKFYDNVKKKPKFMCVIVGCYEAITQDKDTGIYIVPITALKP